MEKVFSGKPSSQATLCANYVLPHPASPVFARANFSYSASLVHGRLLRAWLGPLLDRPHRGLEASSKSSVISAEMRARLSTRNPETGGSRRVTEIGSALRRKTARRASPHRQGVALQCYRAATVRERVPIGIFQYPAKPPAPRR